MLKKVISYINARKYLKYSLGILTGGSIGFLYYWFIGCNSGTCPITSKPINSVVLGSVMGLIWFYSPGKKNKQK